MITASVLALLGGAGALRCSLPPRAPADRLARRAAAARLSAAAVDDAALERDYERYVAAVAMPLSNVDEATAQRTRAVRLRGLLNPEEVAAVHAAGAAAALARPDATIDRSAWGQPVGTWRVSFLNAGGEFEARLPELHTRIRDAMLAADAAHWNATAGVEHVNYRVMEYHTMRSSLGGAPTRGGLHTERHCDHGSLITIDILLSDLADIDGGVLQTLEPDGSLTKHEWEVGDALVFLSHKYHCVSELTRGTRHVMVCELWQGTENHGATRDEAERWQGEWRDARRAGLEGCELGGGLV